MSIGIIKILLVEICEKTQISKKIVGDLYSRDHFFRQVVNLIGNFFYGFELNKFSSLANKI